MNDQWFYIDSAGAQAGPVSEDKLKAILSANNLPSSTMVWKDGMGNWAAASSLEEFQIPHNSQLTQVSTASSALETINPYATPQAQHLDISTMENKTDIMSMLFSFKGRIPRRTYWAYHLATSLIFIVLAFALIFGSSAINDELIIIGAIIAAIFAIPFLWINYALQIKRWHDRDKSGWWVLINFIPYVGGIWSFVENGCLRGTVGNNNYGSDPT